MIKREELKTVIEKARNEMNNHLYFSAAQRLMDYAKSLLVEEEPTSEIPNG